MPKMSASADSAIMEAPLPKGHYFAHVKDEKTEVSKKTDAPMICLQFEIDQGEHSGRVLPGMGGWYYIMMGGRRENGEPHRITTLYETIMGLRAEWTCQACGATTTKPFHKEKIGARYIFACPNCSKPADISFDGSWIGLRCKVRVDLEKMQDSDEERNVVKAVLPRE